MLDLLDGEGKKRFGRLKVGSKKRKGRWMKVRTTYLIRRVVSGKGVKMGHNLPTVTRFVKKYPSDYQIWKLREKYGVGWDEEILVMLCKSRGGFQLGQKKLYRGTLRGYYNKYFKGRGGTPFLKKGVKRDKL